MLRRISFVALCLFPFAALASDGVTTRHFSSLLDFQPYLIGGQEFVTRADTEKLRVTQIAPFSEALTPFNAWNNGVPHAFKIVHSPGGATGVSVDEPFAQITPINITSLTNGLFVTVSATGAGQSVLLSNLKLTVTGVQPIDIATTAHAPATDFLLIFTRRPLVDGFILSGTATFSWTGAIPPAIEQSFELSPVVICEPCDTNCDGSLNIFDIQGLVDAIRLQQPGCSVCAADTNFDGSINQFDIQPFIECLTR